MQQAGSHSLEHLGDISMEKDRLAAKLENKERIIATYRDQLAERSKLESQYQQTVDELEKRVHEARAEGDSRQKEVELLRAEAAMARNSGQTSEATAKKQYNDLLEAQEALEGLQKRNTDLATALKGSQESVRALEVVNEKLHEQTESLRKERHELSEKYAKLARDNAETEQRYSQLEALMKKRSSIDSSRPMRQAVDVHEHETFLAITAASGSHRIANLATDLNEKMRRPAIQPSGGNAMLDEEVRQLAELLEAASEQLQTKSNEMKSMQLALQTAVQGTDSAEARLSSMEAHKDELVQRCKMLEMENAIAVEQLTRSGSFGGPGEAGLPPRPATASIQGRATLSSRPLSPSRVSSSRQQSPSRNERAKSPAGHRARTPPLSRHRAGPSTPIRDGFADSKRPPSALMVEEMVDGLKQKFEENGLHLPLDKVNDEVYRLGNRKLCLKVQNERLVVRVGGGFCDLIEYLEKARI